MTSLPSASLTSGVPQGSILGPVLFSLNLLSLGSVIERHNLFVHFYADDLQLFLPLFPNDPSKLNSSQSCLMDIQQWLSQSFIHLNESKTECIILGSSDAVPSLGAPSSYCKLGLQRFVDVVDKNR